MGFSGWARWPGVSSQFCMRALSKQVMTYFGAGGLLAPSLAIGAGIGNTLHLALGQMQLPMLIAHGMVGYLAAVTQSPTTAFVIIIEMINEHAPVISLRATALIASRVSNVLAPPLYEALSERYR
ncbi:H+/Cl- antiporter ClcA [Paraburkholderia sp. WSM4179]|nr:H+/Cl- antiporter ClcA [Paraburkholderia sp. WSM4179]